MACASSISGLWSRRPPCLPVWWRYETREHSLSGLCRGPGCPLTCLLSLLVLNHLHFNSRCYLPGAGIVYSGQSVPRKCETPSSDTRIFTACLTDADSEACPRTQTHRQINVTHNPAHSTASTHNGVLCRIDCRRRGQTGNRTPPSLQATRQ